ncbi:MAG: DUF885 family protein [Terricaulis sp.]
MSAFEGRVEDWTREALRDSPELATRAGVSVEQAGGAYASRLDDRSAIAVEARRSAALRRLAELRAFDVRSLDAEHALTYAVLSSRFEATAAAADMPYGDFATLGGIHPYVLNQLDSAFLTLPEFLDRSHGVANFADANAYLDRLSAVAVAIDAETERARADAQAGVAPPGFIIDATLRALDDISATPAASQPYVMSFRRKLDALVAAEADEATRARSETRAATLLGRAEEITRAAIIPAHQRAAAFLRSIRAGASEDAGVWRLPDGADYYRDALALETSTELTPDEIHNIGLARVRELTGQLDIALRRVGMTEGPVARAWRR